MKQRKILIRWLTIQLCLFLMGMPWLSLLFQKTEHILDQGFWIPRMKVGEVERNLRIFIAHLVPSWLTWICLLPCVAVLVELNPKTDSNESRNNVGTRRATVLVLLWLLCPILVPLVISQFTTPIYYYRFTIAATPALYLLMSHGIWRLPRKVWRIAFLSLILLVAAWSLSNYFSVKQWAKGHDIFMRQRWREFVPELTKKARPGDTLFLCPSFNKVSYGHFADQSASIPLLVVADRPKDEVVERVQRLLRSRKRVWVIRGSLLSPKERIILDFLDRNYAKLPVHFSVLPGPGTRVMCYNVRKSRKKTSP